ncbi:C40 family peptidase [Paradesulfitobacterium aromaticivorans]
MTKVKKIAASLTAASLFITISLGVVTAAPTTIADDLSLVGAGQTELALASSADVGSGVADPAAQGQAQASQNGDAGAAIPAQAVVAKPQGAPAPVKPATSTAKVAPVKSQPAPSRSTSISTAPSKADAIIATAKKYIGVKYRWGGTTPSGFDCSGFVQYAFAKNGVSLPRTSRDQFQVGTAISFNSLKPGDLVFFSLDGDKVIDHDGIYIGNGQFINSASSKGVTIYTMSSYWQSHFVGAKRVL